MSCKGGGPPFLYTAREQKKLRKNLGTKPLESRVGRGLCPFCLHMEARWRTEPNPDEADTLDVRVLCSQCQRRHVYQVSARD